MNNFDFDSKSRQRLFEYILPELENFYSKTKDLKVSSPWDIEKIKDFAGELSFESGNDPKQVIQHTLAGLTKYAVHTPHPNYFGLFNPRPNFASIIGDLITATYNPQLAAWSHSPFANEIETYVINEFGKKFGYEIVDGTFCTGGAESNLTALICALNHRFPDFNETGVKGITKELVIYCSSESHHSIVKAAKMTGLGAQAVQNVPVNSNLQIDINALSKHIKTDRENGLLPFMIVGTAGTTGAGAIDDLNALHGIAKEENLWNHVDAAYGGASIISEKYKHYLSGIEHSDSITLDLHKWLSIPMGASLLLTSNSTILHRSFSVKTNYMPEDGDPNQIVDPYVHSVQWSRRFIGLKMYLPLAIYGWQEYENVINHQIEMGEVLKAKLIERGWDVINQSPLPIVCFRSKVSNYDMTELVSRVNDSGEAWLSGYPIHGKITARVCITNYTTDVKEVEELLGLIERCKN